MSFSQKNKRIALGTAQILEGYGVSRSAASIGKGQMESLLQLCESSGVNTIDTAPVYGEAESILGEQMLSSFKVVTKLSGRPRSSLDITDWVEHEVFSSLKRLSISSLYGLLIHDPEVVLNADGPAIIDCMKRLKDDGFINKIGISIYNPDELTRITPLFMPDIVQAPVNLIDRSLERSGWLEKLKSNDVEIHARSIFLQGLLLLKRKEIPSFAHGWDDIWNLWHDFISGSEHGPVELCLAYPLSLIGLDKIIIGTESIDQFSEILALPVLSHINEDLEWLTSFDDRLINPSKWKQS